MRIRLAIPARAVSAPALDAALEAATRANETLMAQGAAPSLTDMIRGGVRWKPEPFNDGEHFDLAPTVARRGWGDCDDLATALAAEMRLQGDEGARAFVRRSRSSPNRWHALVRAGDGREYDPSVWAGMKEARGASATTQPVSVSGRGAIICMPHQGRWHCRADVPAPGGVHLSGYGRAHVIGDALEEAVSGAALMQEICGDEESDADVVSVGNLFADAVNLATSMVPGGGVAKGALGLASNILSQATGGQGSPGGAPAPLPGGGTMAVPTGGGAPVIIVRF